MKYITATGRVSAPQPTMQDTDGWNYLFVMIEHSLAVQVSRKEPLNEKRSSNTLVISKEEIVNAFFSQSSGGRLGHATPLMEVIS